jgi:hypothetical protein
METSLHLLTRDGAIRVAFSPRLTAEQYAELMVIVDSNSTPSKAELCSVLRAAAMNWRNEIEIEEGTNGHVRAMPY